MKKEIALVFMILAFIIGVFTATKTMQRDLDFRTELISKLLGTKYEKGTSIAIIKTTDRYGNPVDAKTSVVCMAEMKNETLLCRVESVE